MHVSHIVIKFIAKLSNEQIRNCVITHANINTAYVEASNIFHQLSGGPQLVPRESQSSS